MQLNNSIHVFRVKPTLNHTKRALPFSILKSMVSQNFPGAMPPTHALVVFFPLSLPTVLHDTCGASGAAKHKNLIQERGAESLEALGFHGAMCKCA